MTKYYNLISCFPLFTFSYSSYILFHGISKLDFFVFEMWIKLRDFFVMSVSCFILITSCNSEQLAEIAKRERSADKTEKEN